MVREYYSLTGGKRYLDLSKGGVDTGNYQQQNLQLNIDVENCGIFQVYCIVLDNNEFCTCVFGLRCFKIACHLIDQIHQAQGYPKVLIRSECLGLRSLDCRRNYSNKC